MSRLTAPLGRTVIFLCALCNLATAWATPPTNYPVTRTLTLTDLGLSQHVSLSNRNFEQHFYFPVPQGVALQSAHFEIHGTYLHPFAEAAAITLLVNGTPMLTRRLPDYSGKADAVTPGKTDATGNVIDITLPLRELRSQGGFLDLGVVLNSQLDAAHCIDERGRGNELSIDTSATQLIYSFESGSVQDISTLLTTLPHHPVILLPGRKLSEIQYDTALRLSLALSGMGLQPEFSAVPQVGDTVDTALLANAANIPGVHIPAAMSDAIRQHKPYRITQAVEAAIWLALRMQSPDGLAQVVISPEQTRQALQAVLQGMDNVLGKRLWQELRLDQAGDWLPGAKLDQANVRIAMLAGQEVLALEGKNMRKGADLIATNWHQLADSRELALNASLHVSDKDSSLPHIHFASTLPVQNVGESAQWVVPIPLSQLPRNKWPDSFELNLMAAPSGDGFPPVVSVFMNDNLLTALSLRTDGEITRLRARIPLYALRASNLLRVEIRRRISGGHCSGTIQSFPVQLLPSSFLSLRDARKARQFFMLGTRFSRDSELVVPARYLQDATNTLPVIAAVLRGLSVSETDFRLITDAQAGFSPAHSFVSFETPPNSSEAQVIAGNGRLVVRNKHKHAVFDSTGLGNLAVLQLLRSGRQDGISVITVNGSLPSLRKPLELSSGNLAIADATGTRLAIDMDGAASDWQLDEQNRSTQAFLWRYRIWFFLLGLALLPVIVVFGLRWHYRRRNPAD